jgi:hypothetical protein
MSVVIDIAAQFTGKRAFSQAESAADKLGKTVKRALIGVGVTAFAKSAITAFAQNEKQLQLFNNSLENIGFAFAIRDSKAFLDTLELQYGVVGEQLIPAYQQLLTTTRSLAATQNLTNLALDIAARQGISVSQAADALSKAYLGNTRAIGALGLGISKATLESGDFAKIIKEIAAITKGSAAKGADTLAGKMARLSVAADKAREAIGAGLVAALMAITDSTDIDQLQTKIIAFGESSAKYLADIGKLIKDNIVLIQIFGAAFVASLAVTKVAAFILAVQSIAKAITALRNSAVAAAIASMFMLNPLGAAAMALGMLATIGLVIKGIDLLIDKANEAGNTISSLEDPSDRGRISRGADAAAAKAAKDAKAAAAAQLKATQASTKAMKDQAKLKKSQGILDIEQAGILAALQGKITENDKIRLQLQLALLTDNAKEADRLSTALLLSQAQTTGLATFIANLPKALNPFSSYPDYVLRALAEIAKLADAMNALKAPDLSPKVNAPTTPTVDPYRQMQSNLQAEFISRGSDVNSARALAASSVRLQAQADAYFRDNPHLQIDPMTGSTINVQVQIGNQEITDFVTNAQINNSASGIKSNVNRLQLID